MKAARTPARKIPGRRFLFRKGRGAGMTRPKNRPPAGKGMAPVRTKNKSLTTGLTHGRTFVSGTYTSRKSKLIPATNKYDTKIPGREYSRTTHPGISDEDADRPHHPTDRPPDLPGEKPPKKGFFLMRLPLISPLRREEPHPGEPPARSRPELHLLADVGLLGNLRSGALGGCGLRSDVLRGLLLALDNGGILDSVGLLRSALA